MGQPQFVAPAALIAEFVKEAPKSWLEFSRGSRLFMPPFVQIQWDVQVSEVRDAAKRSVLEHKTVTLESAQVTAPLGRVVWSLVLDCVFAEPLNGSKLSAYTKPSNTLTNSFRV